MTPARALQLTLGDQLIVAAPGSKFTGRIGKFFQASISGRDVIIQFKEQDGTFTSYWFAASELEPIAMTLGIGDPVDDYSVKRTVRIVEKPCITCSRKNFITDKKCWWCETENPTQARTS